MGFIKHTKQLSYFQVFGVINTPQNKNGQMT